MVTEIYTTNKIDMIAKMAADLEAAFAGNQFAVYYQPKYDIRIRNPHPEIADALKQSSHLHPDAAAHSAERTADGASSSADRTADGAALSADRTADGASLSGSRPRLCGAEALIRWEHPELGTLTADQFLPLIEQKGMLHRLDMYVWEQAAAQISAWKKESGITVPVSVNVSREDLNNPDLSRLLLDIIRRHGVRTNDFLLEIREADYTADPESVTRAVEDLKSHGFRIAMDDFGRGSSSLNMLIILPVDQLKMDMHYLSSTGDREKAYRMVRFIKEVADYLHFDIIAEGVEFEEEIKLLREIGCDMIQGFYFSRPLPADQFTKLLA